MGASRNQESTRQEKDGVVYYDRGVLTGKDGRRYQRYAIHTHFVQPGEDQAELVRRYVLPLYQPGDCLSFTAKVMGMCTNNVRTLEDTHPGFWAKTLAPFAGHNSTGIGMHQPYKMQLVIEICGLPRVLFAAAVSAITRPFGIRGLFYKICGHGVAGIRIRPLKCTTRWASSIRNTRSSCATRWKPPRACRPSSWMRTTLTRISSARARIFR